MLEEARRILKNILGVDGDGFVSVDFKDLVKIEG